MQDKTTAEVTSNNAATVDSKVLLLLLRSFTAENNIITCSTNGIILTLDTYLELKMRIQITNELDRDAVLKLFYLLA
jgi:hypothetical protein